MIWKALELACITGGALFGAAFFIDGLRDSDKWFNRCTSLRNKHPYVFFFVGSGARQLDNKEMWIQTFRRQQKLLLFATCIMWLAFCAAIVFDL